MERRVLLSTSPMRNSDTLEGQARDGESAPLTTEQKAIP